MDLFVAELVKETQDIIASLRVQNYHEGCMRFRIMLSKIQKHGEYCVALLESEENRYLLASIMQALESDDIILFADLLEDGWLPMLHSYGAAWSRDPVLCGGYQIEPTASGYNTVKVLAKNFYLHSNGNPMEEARMWLEQCYDPEKQEYAVWGCGLGYHILRLYEYSKGAVKIHVFEEDGELLGLAKEYGVLRELPEDVVEYVQDTCGREFAACIAKADVGILIHFPSVKKIVNRELQAVMREFFAKWNGTVQCKRELMVNFQKNRRVCRSADELELLFKGKSVVLIGAGPSLDCDLEYLRENSDGKVLVAVTTVLKKLLEEGIPPHVAVVMDAQERTYGHMDGVPALDIPLVLDSTAYWKFAWNHVGTKYIACQQGFREAEELAKTKGYRIHRTGGSVITLALDVVLQLGAKEVTFVGVDMAYPEGKSHAGNTMDRKMRSTENLLVVEAVDGTEVHTDTLFNVYRKWIEDEIERYPQVTFINRSPMGAKIKGTKGIR